MLLTQWLENLTRGLFAPSNRRQTRQERSRISHYRQPAGIEILEDRTLLASAFLSDTPRWSELGPGPTTGNGNVAGNPGSLLASQQFPVAGAVEAIAVSPTDPNLIFVGTVNGGVWRTSSTTPTDGIDNDENGVVDDEMPSWTPLTDQFGSLAISALAFSPLDPSGNTLFAGTGQFSNGIVGGPGVGLLRTTNGGDEWMPLGQASLSSLRIRAVVPTSTMLPTGQLILVATVEQGVMRSIDGGQTFVPLGGIGGPGTSASDLIVDPANPNRFYAAVPGQGIFVSSGNNGLVWTSVNTGLAGILGPAGTGSVNIRLSAQIAGGRTTLYAGIVQGNQPSTFRTGPVLTGVFFDTTGNDGVNNDGDAQTDEADEFNWQAIGAVPAIHPGAQGFNNFSILADPTTQGLVYVGGDTQPVAPFVGNLFAGNANTGIWNPIVLGGTPDGSAPHPDSRVMVFDNNNNILQGDDGGIYRLLNPASNNRQWVSMNGDLGVTEIYSVAYDNVNNQVVGGSQDTGVVAQTNGRTWTNLTGGDGNTVAVDNTTMPPTRYRMSNNFNSFRRNNTNVLLGATANDQAIANATNANPIVITSPNHGLVSGAGVYIRNVAGNGAANGIRVVNVINPNQFSLFNGAGNPIAGSGTYAGGGVWRPLGLNAPDTATTGGGFFITPYVLNKVAPAQILIGLNGLYEDNQTGAAHQTGDVIANITGNLPGYNGRDGIDDDLNGIIDDEGENEIIISLAYGGRRGGVNQSNVAFVGTNQQLFFRGEGAIGFNSLSGVAAGRQLPIGQVQDIVLDRQDWRRVYVLVNNQIWMCDNVANPDVDFINLDPMDRLATLAAGGLVPAPGAVAPVLRSIELVGNTVVVGGLGGVFRRLNGVWTEFGRDLPNIIVEDLHYDSTDDVLVAGTFGRGVWRMPGASFWVNRRSVLRIGGDILSDDLIAIGAAPNNPSLLRVSIIDDVNTSPGPVKEWTFQQSVIEEITILGDSGGSDTIVVDFQNGPLIPSVFNVADDLSDETDSLRLRGTTNNDVVTVNSESVVFNGYTLNYGTQRLAIQARDGMDVISVDSVADGTRVTIDAGEDDDDVFIADGKYFDFFDADILGEIVVNGGNGADELTIEDADSEVGFALLALVEDRYTLTSTTFQKTVTVTDSVGPEDYIGPMLTFEAFAEFTLNASAAINNGLGEPTSTINIEGVAEGTSLTINANRGDDAINVGNGRYLDYIQGPITIEGGDGHNELTIEDHLASTPIRGTVDVYTLDAAGKPLDRVTRFVKSLEFLVGDPIVAPELEFDDFATVRVRGSADNGRFDVEGMHENYELTLEGNDGRDTFNIGHTDIDARILGTVVVRGGRDADTLQIDDLSDRTGNDYSVTSRRFTKPTMQGSVEYSSIAVFNLGLNPLSNTVDIHGTWVDTVMTIHGNSGSDTFRLAPESKNLDALKGQLILYGDDGENGLQIFDGNYAFAPTGGYTVNTYRIDEDEITRTFDPDQAVLFAKFPGVEFSGMSEVSLQTGISASANSIEILDTKLAAVSDFALSVETIGGLNRVEIGNGRFDNIGSLVSITGRGGATLVTIDDSSDDGEDSYYFNEDGFRKSNGSGHVTYENVANVTLEANPAENQVEFNHVPAGMSLAAKGHGGADAFYVNGAPEGNVFVLGGSPTLADVAPDAGDRLYVTGTGDEEVDSVHPNDDNDAGSGVLAVDGFGTIRYEELEPLYIDNVAKVTFITNLSRDDIIIDSPESGWSRIAGTTGGVEFESLVFQNIPEVVLDFARDDQEDRDDSLEIRPGGLDALGLERLVVLGGGGDFSVTGLAHAVVPVTIVTGERTETFVSVTNTNDNGLGSLRNAIRLANSVAEGGVTTISFAIPTGDPGYIDVDSHIPGGDPEADAFLISPTIGLPDLTRGNIVLNGASQQNVSGDTNPFGPEIVLSGQRIAEPTNGLHLSSNGNRVIGLNIRQFTGAGVLISGDGNLLTGNSIGTDATGTEGRGNAGDGVRIVGSGNVVIGPTAAFSRLDPEHVLQIGDTQLNVTAYSWAVDRPFDFDSRPRGSAQIGLFYVETVVTAAGKLYEELITGRRLGDIVLQSYDATGELYQTWTLDDARVVSYAVSDDTDTITPTVQLAFGFQAIQTTFYQSGVGVPDGTSRIGLSGDTIEVSGGGAGPENATSGEHLLEILADDALVVEAYSWGLSKPYDFHQRLRGEAQPELFSVRTRVTDAGGLFADLAAGRILGDITLRSFNASNELYQTWTLEKARIVSYTVSDDVESGIPEVELSLGFDAIETTFYEDGVAISDGVSRLELSGDVPVASGGGVGPEDATNGEHQLEIIDDNTLLVDSYSWGLSKPFDFDERLRGEAQPQRFSVRTQVINGGGLFADLVAGRRFGDITLHSFDSAGDQFQTWTLENAQVVTYSVMDDDESGIPTVQLSFGFDAIETSFYEDGNTVANGVSRLDLGGDAPTASGGGAGPEIAASGEHLLEMIDGGTLLVESYSWGVSTPFDFNERLSGEARPQLFSVQTQVIYAGGLFADLAMVRNLGNIRLHSYGAAGNLYQTWTLENVQIVAYSVMDDAESGIPDVQLSFGFDAVETVFYEEGTPIMDGRSRLDLSGDTVEVSGGGSGPENAIHGEHLLEIIGDETLAVDSYSWGVSTPFDFDERFRGEAQSELFAIHTHVTNAGGLFADLAAGRDLGDLTLYSRDIAGELHQTWTLENARVVTYVVRDDADSDVPGVQLSFGFDAIEATFYQDGIPIVGGTSRLNFSGSTPAVSGGGPGPDNAVRGDHLLEISDNALAVDSYSWSISTPFDFEQRLRGDAQPQLFYVQTDVTYAGLLFTDLAAGGPLGDIELHSYDPSGILFQTWTLQNAKLVSYRLTEEAGSLVPKVQLGFGFDAISAAFAPGAMARTENVIAFNDGSGVTVEGGGGNTIRGNAIYANGGLGIDLSGDGITPNDGRDLDEGPNDLQNIPVIGLAQTGTTTRVAGNLHSTPLSTFTLDFYAINDQDPSGHGEGRRWLDSVLVTTDAAGNGSYEALLEAATNDNELITATATNANGSTSEFSQSIADDVPANTFVVTNTNDSGVGSLRNAIVAANLVDGTDRTYVWFRLPTTDPGFVDIDSHLIGGDHLPDVYVFTPQTALPALTRGNITVDGESQFEVSGRGKNPFGPMIVLKGATIRDAANGLHLASENNHVQGLNIQQFPRAGIRVTGNANVLRDNYIGTDATGTEDLGNSGIGVFIVNASSNTVDGNLVSGNDINGIVVGAGSTNNIVRDNRVGTNATGTEAIGNTLGVHLANAPNNLVEGNLLSGNLIGLDISGQAAVGNIVRDNLIGTNADGTLVLPNRADGVFIDNAPGNHLLGNIISGNVLNGVNIVGADASGNVLEGNSIGTRADGLAALGNGEAGVSVQNSAGNLIGGSESDARNLISGNLTGVQITGTQSTGNRVAGNYIGVGLDGETKVANYHGIVILGNTDSSDFGAFNNQIGGTTEAEKNVISGNDRFGIFLTRTLGNTVQGNFIGTDASGTKAIANHTGILVLNDRDSVIGGDTAGATNVISGNQSGVGIRGGLTYRTRVEGNRIGTTADGREALSNTNYGVAVDGVHDVTIGGAGAEFGNLISGNGLGGVRAIGSNLTNLRIQGNKIGTDVDGVNPLPNGRVDSQNGGVLIDNADGVLVGGTEAGAGNLISGNNGSGVTIIGGGEHVIQGNSIGTTADGMSALGNRGAGIEVRDSATNLIGGTTDATRNVIADNEIGVYITGVGSTDNSAVGNYIGVARDGAKKLGNFDGLLVSAGATRTLVGGTSPEARNVISGSRRFGLWVNRADETHIQGNYVGLDASGTRGVANFSGGIHVTSDNTLIGGTEKGAGNVITGNSVGISVGSGGPGVMGTRIQGNLIGTTPDGQSHLFQATGIYVTASGHHMATDVVIGGTDATARNVISGNIVGIHVLGENANEIRIQGNYVGTDIDGAEALPNETGVRIENAYRVLIGGTQDGDGNLISGNSGNGVTIIGGGNHTLQGNSIGIGSDGATDLGNFDGILLTSTSHVQIGGTEPNTGNVISGNARYGVGVGASAFTTIQGNLIGTDHMGETAVGNGLAGVELIGYAVNTLIGGDVPNAGNVISGNVHGVRVAGAGATEQTRIQGNLIGTTASGKQALPNQTGVSVLATGGSIVRDTVIGGPTTGAGNVISGNTDEGIRVAGTSSDERVTVQGNVIGTNFDGGSDLGNGSSGVLLQDTADTTLRGNVISGNGANGVFIIGSTPTTDVSSVIEDNFIGTDTSGTRDLGNTLMGVRIAQGVGAIVRGNVVSGNDNTNIHVDATASQALIENNLIGTDHTGNVTLLDPSGASTLGVTLVGYDNTLRSNVISANPAGGVSIDGMNVADGRGTGNVLEQNFIGVGLDGATPLGNGRYGVRLWRGASRNIIGMAGSALLSGEVGNTVAFNSQQGVVLVDHSTAGNTIRRNAIHSNGGLGIDLGNDGVTPNDDGDTTADPQVFPDEDTGPNSLQNAPDLASAISATATRVSGQLRSTPSSTFIIDFYANAEADPSGFGEGGRWLGFIEVTTNELGVAGFSTQVDNASADEFISAAATNAAGSTSEFSNARIVRGRRMRGPGGRPSTATAAEITARPFLVLQAEQLASSSSEPVSDPIERTPNPTQRGSRISTSLPEEPEADDRERDSNATLPPRATGEEPIDLIFAEFEDLLSEAMLST